VKVYELHSSRNQAGWATLNYDPKTNTAWYGSLHLNTRYLTNGSARRKTACHELGHIFGLEHRRTGRTCMRDGFTTMYGHPDATDYATLQRIYRRP
jgi:predicted Zn-dependent protease